MFYDMRQLVLKCITATYCGKSKTHRNRNNLKGPNYGILLKVLLSKYLLFSILYHGYLQHPKKSLKYIQFNILKNFSRAAPAQKA